MSVWSLGRLFYIPVYQKDRKIEVTWFSSKQLKLLFGAGAYLEFTKGGGGQLLTS